MKVAGMCLSENKKGGIRCTILSKKRVIGCKVKKKVCLFVCLFVFFCEFPKIGGLSVLILRSNSSKNRFF